MQMQMQTLLGMHGEGRVRRWRRWPAGHLTRVQSRCLLEKRVRKEIQGCR